MTGTGLRKGGFHTMVEMQCSRGTTLDHGRTVPVRASMRTIPICSLGWSEQMFYSSSNQADLFLESRKKEPPLLYVETAGLLTSRGG